MGRGKFQGHEPCPRCGSRDNLASWSDGKWCFGCGLVIPGYKSMSVEDIRKQIQYDDNKDKKQRVAYLPSDFTLDLPGPALEWVQQYGITDNERLQYKIGWTDEHRSLVLPAFDVYGTLMLVQFRRFQPGNDGLVGTAKYYTRGNPESVLWTVPVGTTDVHSLCLVEDFLSSLRVGRHTPASPLWGSGLSLGQIKRISDRFERLTLWLDFDKASHALGLKMKAQPYFKEVNVIISEKDPKAYDDSEIAGYLGSV